MHIQLIDRVLAQIELDVDSGDLTAIYDLIADIPDEKAVHYLTDESLAEVMERDGQYLSTVKHDPNSPLAKMLRERLGK